MPASDPDAFFADLVGRALAGARAAPRYVSSMPMVGRGWRLTFRLATSDETVELNAIRHDEGFAYAYLPAEPGPRARHLDRVGHLLCRALERTVVAGAMPDPSQAFVAEHPEDGAPREALRIYLPGHCDRGCVFCSVSVQRATAGALPLVRPEALSREWSAIEARLREHGERAAEVAVEWSGKDCLASPLFDDALELAHALGYRRMGVQSPGSRLAEPGFAEHLAEHGVDHASLTAHAADPETFDHVGGKGGAHRIFWEGVARLRAVGIRISLEVPCVGATVEGLPAHVTELAERMGERTPITIFFWYPSDDMEHTYRERGVDFVAALESLGRLRAALPRRRVAVNGIPECVAPRALREHFFWSYGRQHMSFVAFDRVDACAECAARDRCPGIVPSYARTFSLEARPLTERGSPASPG